MVEERMSSNGCLQHWLVTGRASSLKISAPIIPHGIYFPSTPLPSPLSLLHGGMVLNRMYGEGESRWKTGDPGLRGRTAMVISLRVIIII